MSKTIERGFDYVDGRHVPTLKIVLGPCGADDNEAWEARNSLADRIEALLAAPAVERQEQAAIRAGAVKAFSEWYSKNPYEQLTNATCGLMAFKAGAAYALSAENQRITPADPLRTPHPLEEKFRQLDSSSSSSPPAPVAVTDLIEAVQELLVGTGTSPGAIKRYGRIRACLDKIKEMNK